jgi:hypothetical protein
MFWLCVVQVFVVLCFLLPSCVTQIYNSLRKNIKLGDFGSHASENTSLLILGIALSVCSVVLFGKNRFVIFHTISLSTSFILTLHYLAPVSIILLRPYVSSYLIYPQMPSGTQ